jgi:hypothetical protein
LPAGSELPDAPWIKKPANYFDRFDPDAFLKSTETDLPNAPTYGTAESVYEGALKGASANWRDEIYGASEASGLPRALGGFRAPVGAGRLAYEHLTGTRGPATEEYERARDEMRARQRAMQTQHPMAFGAGELGGAAASILAVPGSSAATVPARLSGAGEGQGAGRLIPGSRREPVP